MNEWTEFNCPIRGKLITNTKKINAHCNEDLNQSLDLCVVEFV